MSRKTKPLTKGQRGIITQLAAVMVCASLEASAVAPQYEKLTGKKYDHRAATSYLNTFLNANPEYRRVWILLLKDKAMHERDFLERLRRDNGK